MNFFVVYYLLVKIEKVNMKEEKEIIVMWFWVFSILFVMVGYIIVIYNGKEYIFIYIINFMVGCKLGEFVLIWYFMSYESVRKDIKFCC